MIENKSENWA